ncbi:MAG: DNA alkylation repair protein [Bacillota bacterium]
MDVPALAQEIDRCLAALPPDAGVPEFRRVRREYTEALRGVPAQTVLELALTLLKVHGRRGTAYELVHHHRAAFRALTPRLVEELGEGLSSWGATDAFGAYISGPAWHAGLVNTAEVQRWAGSADRWWRRAALVSCIYPRGGVERTLAVCRLLVHDRDDMVVKAMSWALRELVRFDRAAVEGFLSEYERALAARVKRELRHKLRTGLKNLRRA